MLSSTYKLLPIFENHVSVCVCMYVYVFFVCVKLVYFTAGPQCKAAFTYADWATLGIYVLINQ